MSGLPHQFPPELRDVDWLISWTCRACGSLVREGNPSACTVDWRADR